MRPVRNNQRLVCMALVMLCTSVQAIANPANGSSDSAISGESAPDIAAGREKSKTCVACHGEEGISKHDNYPHLRGQRQTYLLREMRAFRDGVQRRDPIMTPMLKTLSDADLVNLAAYYGSFDSVLGSSMQAPTEVVEAMPTPAIQADAAAAEPVPATVGAEDVSAVSTAPVASTPADTAATAVTGVVEAGKAKSAACAACHGVDGRGTAPLFPNLHDQKPEYLARQLDAFRAGTRQDATMTPMATSLSDQDIADLAAYYSSLR